MAYSFQALLDEIGDGHWVLIAVLLQDTAGAGSGFGGSCSS
jgi:hypothetical protein